MKSGEKSARRYKRVMRIAEIVHKRLSCVYPELTLDWYQTEAEYQLKGFRPRARPGLRLYDALKEARLL